MSQCLRRTVAIFRSLSQALQDDRRQVENKGVSLGREGTGWEMAYATCFLLSNEVSYITGQTILADAGAFLSRSRPANDEGLTNRLDGSNAR